MLEAVPVSEFTYERLAGSGYEEAVLVAAPLPVGGHVGFIVNRPTSVKLQSAREAPQGDGEVVPLMPGLVAVIDAASVDRVIETTPNDARYFAGLTVWQPGELEDEVPEGAWSVQPASIDAVLGAHSAALWKELSLPRT